MKKLCMLVITSLMMTFNYVYSQGVAINSDGSAPDSSSVLDIKSVNRGVLVPRMREGQRDSIVSPARGLMIFQTNGISGFYYFNGQGWVLITETGTGMRHYIGEQYGGGVVFWVDETGHHGFICSAVDIAVDQPWSNIINVAVGPAAQSDWDGLNNSFNIIRQPGQVNSAAKVSDDYINYDYQTGIFDDWYLPSIDQLSLMFQSKYQIDKTLQTDSYNSTIGLSKTVYWSSTEAFFSTAWVLDIYYGYTYDDSKYYLYSVRAVRNF
ncbi:MAG: DUF1566 domain-containing protein [Bacteroidetes bacterium]|nr:DUF1566 domain-containing protein [Bacteroidota bacterium]